MTYMLGAEPFELPGGEAGVLLLHGFSGSCSEVRVLGERLAAAGFGVLAPALAGHGTKPSDLQHVTPDDFIAKAESAFKAAERRFARTYVVGLSMGGTLGLHLAAHHRVAGLVGISTPVFMSNLIERSVPFAKRLMPNQSVISNYAAWRGEVVGYRKTPVSSIGVFMDVLESVKGELPLVRVPLLLLHATGDETVPVANAEFIASLVSSPSKAVRIYPGGRHIMTLPPQLAIIEGDLMGFLREQEAPYVIGNAARSGGAEV